MAQTKAERNATSKARFDRMRVEEPERFAQYLAKGRAYHHRRMAARGDEIRATRRVTDGLRREDIRAYDKQRRNVKRKQINTLKANTPCMDCGQCYPSVCMDFDHRPGVTKHPALKGHKAASMVVFACAFKAQTVAEEIAKCDIVCSNCHRIRTQQRREENGTTN